jgi:hypothetical protein
MDYQDSARAQEREAKGIGKGMRKETIATGDYRVEGWPQQAASKDPGITTIYSERSRSSIEQASRSNWGTSSR